jgi:hypothetical protein
MEAESPNNPTEASSQIRKAEYLASKTAKFGQKENEKNRRSSIRRKGLKVEFFGGD